MTNDIVKSTGKPITFQKASEIHLFHFVEHNRSIYRSISVREHVHQLNLCRDNTANFPPDANEVIPSFYIQLCVFYWNCW